MAALAFRRRSGPRRTTSKPPRGAGASSASTSSSGTEQAKGQDVQEETVSIASAGLRLSGIVAVPEGVNARERRAAFLVLHGFGSNKNSPTVLGPCKVLNELGYVTLRFDM